MPLNSFNSVNVAVTPQPSGGMETTLIEACAALERHGMQPRLEGDPSRHIIGVATLEDAGESEISFLANPKYEKLLATTRAAAVVVAGRHGPQRSQSDSRGRPIRRDYHSHY